VRPLHQATLVVASVTSTHVFHADPDPHIPAHFPRRLERKNRRVVQVERLQA